MWRKRPSLSGIGQRVVKDEQAARDRTMNRAVKLLAAKPRSTRELRDRLLEKLWTNEKIVDGVLEALKGYGYLDDEQYARDVALSKLRQKPQGRRRLQNTLLQKKLDRDAIESAVTNAFETVPEETLIAAAIERHVRLKGSPGTREEVKTLYDHLLRLGFGYELISEKLSQYRK